MSSGTFVDSSGQINLDGDCLLIPDLAAPVAGHRPTVKTGEVLFDVGGESQTLRVTGECQRHSLGDAEWYLYQKLLALGASTTGVLTVTGQAYGNCAFVSGTGEIGGHEWVTYRYEFLQGDNSSGDVGSAGAEPGEYAARTSAGAFTFAGTALGEHARISGMSISRDLITKHLGRGRGIRIKDVAHARSIQLSLTCWVSKATRASIEDYLIGLYQTLGSMDGSLVGNGNTFTDCHITGIKAEGVRDELWHYFTVDLTQEVT